MFSRLTNDSRSMHDSSHGTKNSCPMFSRHTHDSRPTNDSRHMNDSSHITNHERLTSYVTNDSSHLSQMTHHVTKDSGRMSQMTHVTCHEWLTSHVTNDSRHLFTNKHTSLLCIFLSTLSICHIVHDARHMSRTTRGIGHEWHTSHVTNDSRHVFANEDTSHLWICVLCLHVPVNMYLSTLSTCICLDERLTSLCLYVPVYMYLSICTCLYASVSTNDSRHILQTAHVACLKTKTPTYIQTEYNIFCLYKHSECILSI